MAQQDTSEEFRHEYADAVKAVKLNRFEVTEELRKDLGTGDGSQAREALVVTWNSLNDEIANDLSLEVADAEIAYKHALRSLERVQACRFLIENLLEAIKRDESLNNTVKNYQNLGLFPESPGLLPEEKRNSPWPWRAGGGAFLKKIMKGLKKLALILIELVVNAVKAIPRFVEIEIRPHIGVVGPFPTLTFDFGLQAKGTIRELFEALFMNVEG